MNDFDWSDLDARLLQLLVAVVEAGSITRAAHALGVTQSAVSHQLDKLRAITGDALFVKSGRGIVATARAERPRDPGTRTAAPVAGLRAKAAPSTPARWQATVTIAANDFQRDVLLPRLMAQALREAGATAWRCASSRRTMPSLDMLRDGVCDLAISPRPPEGSDIVQKRLFEDRVPASTTTPACGTHAASLSLKDYLAADHITVMYAPRRALHLDRTLASPRRLQRRFAVMVPGFAGDARRFCAAARCWPPLRALLRQGFAGATSRRPRCPRPCPAPKLPMYLIWHRRHHQDAAHRWLRGAIRVAGAGVMAGRLESRFAGSDQRGHCFALGLPGLPPALRALAGAALEEA